MVSMLLLRGTKQKLGMTRNTEILVTCVYITVMLNLISICWLSRSDAREHHSPKVMLQLDRGLEKVPVGSTEVETLNIGYNEIEILPDYVFWNNSYKNAKKIILSENCIHTIEVHAFKGLKHLKMVDLSTNNFTYLDPYTFKSNRKLEKLILLDNLISFQRTQTFLISHSIETLVLSKNKITEIYDATFLGVPNIRQLILSDNELNSISQHAFKHLGQLEYLALTNTGVYRLGESMFRQIPRIVNLEGTPLSLRFNPPLKEVNDEAVRSLFSLVRIFGS